MKQKTSKIIAFMLAAIMCISTTSVFAASTGSVSNDTSIGEDVVQNAQTKYSEFSEGTVDTEVYLTVDNKNIIVGVPTEVIISGIPNDRGSYVGEYAVAVKGDIAGNELICVTPDSETVTLQQTGKSNKTANILQEQTMFDCNEIASGTTTNGTITAEGLTAGSWHSDFNFNVSIIKINRYYSSIELAAQDINDNTINSETSVADMPTAEGAACGVYKNSSTGTYRIEVYKDLSNVQAITLNENTEIDLNNYEISFADTQSLIFSNSAKIENGTIYSNNALVTVSQTLNTGNFVLNNVNINSNGTNDTSVTSIETSALQNDFETVNINTYGNDVKSYGIVNNGGEVNLRNVKIDVYAKGENSINQAFGIYARSSTSKLYFFNDVSVSAKVDEKTSGKVSVGVFLDAGVVNLYDADIYSYTNIPNKPGYALYGRKGTTINIYDGTYQTNVDTEANDIGDIVNIGLSTYGNLNIDESIKPVKISGGNTAIAVRDTSSIVNIKGGTFKSANHGGLYNGNCDTINITGGIFYNSKTASEDVNTNCQEFGGIYSSGAGTINIENAVIMGGLSGLRIKSGTANINIKNSFVKGIDNAFSVSSGLLTVNDNVTTEYGIQEIQQDGGTVVDNRR